MRLLHPWSGDLICCATAAAAGKRSSQLAQGTSRRLRTPASDKDKAMHRPPAKTPVRHRPPMYNYASPLPHRRDKPTHARNCSTSWILPFCAGRFRLGQGLSARPFDGWTLPKSLWIGQGHI